MLPNEIRSGTPSVVRMFIGRSQTLPSLLLPHSRSVSNSLRRREPGFAPRMHGCGRRLPRCRRSPRLSAGTILARVAAAKSSRSAASIERLPGSPYRACCKEGTPQTGAISSFSNPSRDAYRLHAVATYLKTFQALSYERLQGALADLFGLTISQGGLMNLLRRARGRFQTGHEAAVAARRRAAVVASDETGVRIEGANAYHGVFRCPDAVVHQAAPTRAASVIRALMDGHRPAVWLSDRYSAQQGHAGAQQTCLAHLARDVAYAREVSEDPVPWRLELWLRSAYDLAGAIITTFAASTLAAKRRALERRLADILQAPTKCDLA